MIDRSHKRKNSITFQFCYLSLGATYHFWQLALEKIKRATENYVLKDPESQKVSFFAKIKIGNDLKTKNIFKTTYKLLSLNRNRISWFLNQTKNLKERQKFTTFTFLNFLDKKLKEIRWSHETVPTRIINWFIYFNQWLPKLFLGCKQHQFSPRCSGKENRAN